MPRWQAIIFDLDDTLYPEHSYVLSGFYAVAEYLAPRIGIEASQCYDTLKTLFLSGVRGNTFNLLLTHYCAPSTWTSDMIEVYRSHTPKIAPFPEVPPLLKRLQEFAKLGLLSDGYLSVQQKKWDVLQLDTYFDVVTFSDRWGRESWKPNAKPFVHTQSLLKVNKIVYVADNPLKDFFGARRCNWDTIWIRREGAEYAYHEPPGPDFMPDATVSNFNDLERILRNRRP